jgi:hypothetical protein
LIFLEDAVVRAQALTDGAGDSMEHFENLLTESLEKEIPKAWCSGLIIHAALLIRSENL